MDNNKDNERLFSGQAWKHHISEYFVKDNYKKYPSGAGKGGTIFTDYDKMLDYLNKDGRRWHIAELNLQNEPLLFEFGNSYMATIQRDFLSEKGFEPYIKENHFLYCITISNHMNELISEGWEFSLHYGDHKTDCDIKQPCWQADFTRMKDDGLWDNHECGYGSQPGLAVEIAYRNIKNGVKSRKSFNKFN